ncbi:MAG TPA: AAA family ATPase [bacterium]|nr:AAA family ATPase [bacterium]
MNSLFTRPLQALTLASALSFGAPLMTGCSNASRPTDESSMVTTGTAVPVSGLPPPPSVVSAPARLVGSNPHTVLVNAGVNPGVASPTISAPASSHDNSLLVLTSILAALGAISTVILTWQHLKLRRYQAYAASRALGLTLEEDIRRMEKRLEKSAGDRDDWSTEFLTDLGKVAKNGLLRPARCREADIVDLMNLRKRQLPVISTVVAPSGAGKSRMVEGLVHALYHDRSGVHYTAPGYNAKDRLFSDIDPENLLCFRLNLGQLTHSDAEPMFHYLMQKAERCTKSGGKCLVIIDDAHFLYGPNGHASAARLIHLIDGWTDGQMKDLKGLWGIAMTPIYKYDELIQPIPSRRRRFERYDMTVFSGGRLLAVVDEILDEWEDKLGIRIPKDVRDRVVELMSHPANDMANPYASLNLLDRIQAAMPPLERTMTVQDLHRSFARVYKLPEAEVAMWALYPHILKSIEEELRERFPSLLPRLITSVAKKVLADWKRGDQSFLPAKNADGTVVKDGPLIIPEYFIEGAIGDLYAAIENNPLNFQAQDLMKQMKAEDNGNRLHRRSNVKQLPSASPASERRAANA